MSTNTVKTAPVVNNGAGKSGKDATATPATTTPATATPATTTPAKKTESIAVMIEAERLTITSLVQHKADFESFVKTADKANINMIRSLSLVVKDMRATWKIYKRAAKWNPADMAIFEKDCPNFKDAPDCEAAINAYLISTDVGFCLTGFKDAEKLLKHPVLIDRLEEIGFGKAKQMASTFPDVVDAAMVDAAKQLLISKIPSDTALWAKYFAAKKTLLLDLHVTALDKGNTEQAAKYLNASNDASANKAAIDKGNVTIEKGKVTPATATPATTTVNGTPATTTPATTTVNGTPATTTPATTTANGTPATTTPAKMSVEAREKQLDAYYSGISSDSDLISLRDSMWNQMNPNQKRYWMRVGVITLEYETKQIA